VALWCSFTLPCVQTLPLPSEYVDGIAIDIQGTRTACIYLPPSLSQYVLPDVLRQFSEYDVIVGDLNIKMSGSNRSHVTVREALLHFAEESKLELHEARDELDHLRSCANQLSSNQIDICIVRLIARINVRSHLLRLRVLCSKAIQEPQEIQ